MGDNNLRRVRKAEKAIVDKLCRKTNADHIRNMTDEELAEWIFRNQMFIFKSVCDAFGYTDYDEKEMAHWENILAWLKQEVE